MAHSPLFAQLRRQLAIVRTAATRGVETEQVREEISRRATSRREFLSRAGLAVAGVAALPSVGAAATAPTAKVIVVGAGFSGLTAAYRLKQAGVVAEVHEANSFVGGRVRTGRGFFNDGQIIELGAQFIDTNHTALRDLAAGFSLLEEDYFAGEPAGSEPVFRFNGVKYTFAEADADMKAMWPAMHQDVVDANYPTLYNSYSPRGLQLDKMSIDQWIQATVPGGLASKFGKLLSVAYNTEYGAETHDQSSLNLLYLLGYTKRESMSIYGESDERYHIRGGNDQLGTKLAAALPGQITTSSVLTAVVKRTDGRIDLVFKQGAKTVTRTADKAIFALPFSILRSSVDLTRAGFSALKMTAIRELGMGANSKLHLQFTNRHWHTLGNNGDTYSETGYQSTFDTTRAQTGVSGILTDYTGGNASLAMSQGTTASQASLFLSRIENVLPGLTAKWNKKAVLNHWPANPWSKGAYCYWRVGQVTKFGGSEGERDGNSLFCGEHTSIDFQGFMNGAVETGERAATEVLVDLGLAKR